MIQQDLSKIISGILLCIVKSLDKWSSVFNSGNCSLTHTYTKVKKNWKPSVIWFCLLVQCYLSLCIHKHPSLQLCWPTKNCPNCSLFFHMSKHIAHLKHIVTFWKHFLIFFTLTQVVVRSCHHPMFISITALTSQHLLHSYWLFSLSPYLEFFERRNWIIYILIYSMFEHSV